MLTNTQAVLPKERGAPTATLCRGTPGLLSGTSSPPALQQPSSPCTRPLPLLKDHLFFQRFENDGQEWLSSESDIWEPRARGNPEQEERARSTAELGAL